MKPIIRHKVFDKHFKIRIISNEKLTKQFENRLDLFIKGVRDYPLHDHPLKGSKHTLRAFWVAGDIRVVYRETNEYYEFLDIGSHNQVY